MQDIKRTFVKLVKLQDITWSGVTEKEQADWVANVINSVGENGYGLDVGDDDYATAEFSAEEVTFAEVDCYNFMGSAYEQERFYSADWVVVQEKATGDYYAYETEEIYEM